MKHRIKHKMPNNPEDEPPCRTQILPLTRELRWHNGQTSNQRQDARSNATDTVHREEKVSATPWSTGARTCHFVDEKLHSQAGCSLVPYTPSQMYSKRYDFLPMRL